MPAAAPAASSVLRSSAVTVQHLPEQRAERAAGGDDGPLRAERPAGADGDRRRERLEEGHPRRDAALVGEHLLHRLGDAVAADGLRAVARHQSHDQTADERHEDDPEPQVRGSRPERLERRGAPEGEVGHEVDEPLEHLGNARRQYRHAHRQRTDVRRPPGDVRRVRRDVCLGQARPQRRRDRKSLGGGAGPRGPLSHGCGLGCRSDVRVFGSGSRAAHPRKTWGWGRSRRCPCRGPPFPGGVPGPSARPR